MTDIAVMYEIKYVFSRGELSSLGGSVDSYSGEKRIRLNLFIESFCESGRKDKGIQRVYFIGESGSSNISLTNVKTNKNISLSICSTEAMINADGNYIFIATVNPQQLRYISEHLLTADLRINWNIDGFGFVEYASGTEPPFGRITISNIDRTGTKVSQNDFTDKVWNKIAKEDRYLVDIPDLSSNVFEKAPDDLKEWKETMQKRAESLKEAMRKFESSDSQADFISIARDIKADLDKLKDITEEDENRQVLEGLLFNKLFSGTAVNDASKGMMEGILKIIEGLYKVSNQIGHTATREGKPFRYVGERETIRTFLFITALLFNYIGEKL